MSSYRGTQILNTHADAQADFSLNALSKLFISSCIKSAQDSEVLSCFHLFFPRYFPLQGRLRLSIGPAHILKVHALLRSWRGSPHPKKKKKQRASPKARRWAGGGMQRETNPPAIRCCVWHRGFWCSVSSVEWRFAVTCRWVLETPQKFKDMPQSCW